MWSATSGDFAPSMGRGNAMLPAFTLIELLVAAAISSLVITLLAAILIQLFQVTAQATNRLALVGDTTLAAQTLGRDVNSAATATISSARSLTLAQPAPDGGATNSVVYTLAPPLLLRSENGAEQTIARHIMSESSFGPTGVVTGTRLISVRLVCALGDESLSTTITLGLRAQP